MPTPLLAFMREEVLWLRAWSERVDCPPELCRNQHDRASRLEKLLLDEAARTAKLVSDEVQHGKLITKNEFPAGIIKKVS